MFDNNAPDVVVVGSGIVGLSITYALGTLGIDVTCIGADCLTSESASAASGAMLSAIGEVTDSAQGGQDAQEQRLRVAGQRAYPDFLEAIEARSGLPVRSGMGTFLIANMTNEQDRINLKAMRRVAHEYGVPIESVDPAQIPGLRPAFGYEVVNAEFLPLEGWVDSESLVASLVVAIENLPSARLRRTDVARLLMHGGKLAGVVLEDGTEVSTERVVLAAGVGVQPLLDGLGSHAPALPRLLAGKGVSAIVDAVPEPFEHVVRTPNRDFACGTHVVPRGPGTVYLGATNRIASTPGNSSGVTPGELHALFNTVIHEVNTGFRTANFVGARHGRRPLSSDHYPIIGSTELPGLSVATGTYRNGVLYAPVIAQIIADIICDTQTTPNDFAPDAAFRLSYDRSAHAALAIEQGMRDLISFILEPGGHLPYDRLRELRAFLQAMGQAAISSEEAPVFVRMRELLSEHPISEMVPQVFYEAANGTLPTPRGGGK